MSLRNQDSVISREFLLRRLKTVRTVRTTGNEPEMTHEHHPHQIKTSSTQSHGTDAPQLPLLAPGGDYWLHLLPHKPADHQVQRTQHKRRTSSTSDAPAAQKQRQFEALHRSQALGEPAGPAGAMSGRGRRGSAGPGHPWHPAPCPQGPPPLM